MVAGEIEKKIIGDFFKQKRLETGLTQNDVAKSLGWSNAQFVSNWERGKCLPPKSVLFDLIQMCKISKKELVNIHTYATKIALESYLKNIDSSSKNTTKQR